MKNVVNYVDMTVFKGTMTKWPEQKQTHRPAQRHAEHQVATDIKKETISCVFRLPFIRIDWLMITVNLFYLMQFSIRNAEIGKLVGKFRVAISIIIVRSWYVHMHLVLVRLQREHVYLSNAVV